MQPLELLLLGLPPRGFLDPACQLGIQLFVRVGFLAKGGKRGGQRGLIRWTHGAELPLRERVGEGERVEGATQERREESGWDLVEGEERRDI